MHFLQDDFPKSLPEKGMSDFTVDYGLLTGLPTERSIHKKNINPLLHNVVKWSDVL